MTDPAKRGGTGLPVAVVPDDQLEQFRFMIEHAESPIKIDSVSFRGGDKVRVMKGQLAGLEGVVRRGDDGKTRLSIDINLLGCASVEIDKSYVASISNH